MALGARVYGWRCTLIAPKAKFQWILEDACRKANIIPLLSEQPSQHQPSSSYTLRCPFRYKQTEERRLKKQYISCGGFCLQRNGSMVLQTLEQMQAIDSAGVAVSSVNANHPRCCSTNLPDANLNVDTLHECGKTRHWRTWMKSWDCNK